MTQRRRGASQQLRRKKNKLRYKIENGKKQKLEKFSEKLCWIKLLEKTFDKN